MHTIWALSFLKLAHAGVTHHCPVGLEVLTPYSLVELAGGWRVAGLSLKACVTGGACVTEQALAG